MTGIMADSWIRLIGPPAIEHGGGGTTQPRGRKTWALLAYLMLAPTTPTRQRLASLLFPEADDPLGALRWNLSELRRALGGEVTLRGDPLTLALPPHWHCDVYVVTGSSASRMLHGQSIEGELLEGLSFPDCAAFDAWLAVERRRIETCVQTTLFEEALAALAAGAAREAAELAARAVRLDPFNPDFHAVLVRSLMAAGDQARAREHAARCADLFRRELGVGLPSEVQRALADMVRPSTPRTPVTRAIVHSYLDAAGSSLSAGAADRALGQLRTAVDLAERSPERDLRAESLLALASALIHAAGGRGTEVADLLHRALSFTPPGEASRVAAAAYRELGYLAAQTGAPDKAVRWLDEATRSAEGFPDELAKILGVRGMMTSDTAHYEEALAALAASEDLTVATDSRRQQGFTAAMIGRVHLLLGDLPQAALALDRSLAILAAERWMSLAPLVESLRGQTYLATGDLDTAADLIDHAWVLAEQSGDHCYMDAAANAQARLHLAREDTRGAARWIARGLAPHPWYLWFRAGLLDTACELAIMTRSPDAVARATTLGDMASRCGLRELVVRAHSHRALLGDTRAGEAIPWLARDIHNPALQDYLAGRRQI